MQFESFLESIKAPLPPDGISIYLLAMRYDGQDNWAKAHSLVDNLDDKTSCWVHAFLHRKEGDNWNADYWYRKAGKARPGIKLQQEWEEIVSALL